MFSNAKSIDYYGVWDKTTIVTWTENLTDNIRILHTPGHDYTSITIFVTTKDGIVAICGDVFWKENYPQNPKDDVFASNIDRLKDSREMVLQMADWVIPGHGPMYKIDKTKGKGENQEIKKENKVVIFCKKCGKAMEQKDKCRCRPYLCYRCCQCGLDCDLCNCSHKIL